MKKIFSIILLISSSTVWAQNGNAPSSIVETQCQDFDKVCQEMKAKMSKHYSDPRKSAKKIKTTNSENYTAN